MANKLFNRKNKQSKLMTISAIVSGFIAMASFSVSANAADITMYKSPWCGCCSGWADYMKKNGHNVVVKKSEQMEMIKKMFGVPEDLQACHTAVVGDYIVEGHVPAQAVERFLKEKPKAYGIAVPGMPAGSPGMESSEAEPYNVILFKAGGKREVYARF